MSLLSFFKKHMTDHAIQERELKGVEVVHDSGLTDHESAESQGNAEFKKQALKGKDKSPYKSVH